MTHWTRRTWLGTCGLTVASGFAGKMPSITSSRSAIPLLSPQMIEYVRLQKCTGVSINGWTSKFDEFDVGYVDIDYYPMPGIGIRVINDGLLIRPRELSVAARRCVMAFTAWEFTHDENLLLKSDCPKSTMQQAAILLDRLHEHLGTKRVFEPEELNAGVLEIAADMASMDILDRIESSPFFAVAFILPGFDGRWTLDNNNTLNTWGADTPQRLRFERLLVDRGAVKFDYGRCDEEIGRGLRGVGGHDIVPAIRNS